MDKKIWNKKVIRPRRYVHELDGLRAVAVMTVIIYHLNPDWLPGGLLGVGMFFTLSGYLITDILAGQREARGCFLMQDFWLRRARRLLPAMVTMVAVVSVYALLFDHSRLASLGGDVPAALLYMSNWWFVLHKVSYFESFGPPSPLGHLWSLAVEEQFYLFWPLVLALGLKFIHGRRTLASWLMSLAAASALLMIMLYNPDADPSRVYYGTDTRLFGLLIGAALAVVWPSAKLKSGVSRQASRLLNGTGVTALLLLAAGCWYTNEYDPFLYRGGLVLFSLVTAVLVAVLVHPACRLGWMMAAKPLRWIGERSYGLYLWHYPVITLSTPQIDTNGVSWQRVVLQVGLSLLLAGLSYRYLEQPIRRDGFVPTWRRMRSATVRNRKSLYAGSAAAVILITGAGTLHLLTGGNEQVGPAQAGPAVSGQSEQSSQSGQVTAKNPAAGKTSTASAPGGKLQLPSTAGPASGNPAHAGGQPSKQTASPQSDSKPLKSGGQGITVIGDSVMLDVKEDLEEVLPDAVIDGKVGRQMSEAPGVLDQLKQQGQLGQYVVIELGTNGSFTSRQLDRLLDSLSGAKKIIFVNTRVARPWETAVNRSLNRAAAKDPRIQVVDWFSTSAGKNAYFAGDGVHLNRTGAKAYTAMLSRALREVS
ncbi:acyltransferase family protein [Paenibacillus sp. JX-17]|uniref:Acyltransferase family protein n=1 Tax=Paenibacillus lacisoli TaxID=3064525 RepID=A0ABT9CAT2_9BACL|nr:acyltransferase family protein [Paenibacillus sp. JX-17]MDO7906374.1 acyltransferase family protein [Paenibacillus sp. JX-17]